MQKKNLKTNMILIILYNFLFIIIILLHNVYHKYIITKTTYMQAAPKYFQEYYSIYRFLDT